MKDLFLLLAVVWTICVLCQAYSNIMWDIKNKFKDRNLMSAFVYYSVMIAAMICPLAVWFAIY